jgi:hypothetical protein
VPEAGCIGYRSPGKIAGKTGHPIIVNARILC